MQRYAPQRLLSLSLLRSSSAIQELDKLQVYHSQRCYHSHQFFLPTKFSSPLSTPQPTQALFPSLSHSQPHHIPSTPHHQSRHYAKMSTPKGVNPNSFSGKARPVTVALSSMTTSNMIAEPYKPPSSTTQLPLLRSWLTPTGWKERWQRMLGNLKSVYTMSRCKKAFPGWTLKGFKHDALHLYETINSALAAGDQALLREYSAAPVFSDFQKQVSHRRKGGWSKVEWKFVELPSLRQIEVVHGRMLLASPKDESKGFVQLTVRYNSRQNFAAYDHKGKLMAGGPSYSTDVVDHWVLERALGGNNSGQQQEKGGESKWRLAGRLGTL